MLIEKMGIDLTNAVVNVIGERISQKKYVPLLSEIFGTAEIGLGVTITSTAAVNYVGHKWTNRHAQTQNEPFDKVNNEIFNLGISCIMKGGKKLLPALSVGMSVFYLLIKSDDP